MKIRVSLPLCLWAAAILLAGSVSGLANKTYTEDVESEHKRSFFLRAAEKTPQAQLAYADALLEKGKLKKADRQFRALLNEWPTAPEAAVAQHKHAQVLLLRGKYQDAFDELQKLIDTYPGRFDYDDVLQTQFDIAVEVMNRRVGKFLFLPGFKAPERALGMLKQIVRNGPRWKHAPEAQYLQGSINENIQEYELAVLDYTETLLRYPSSPYAEKGAFGRARTLVQLSDSAPNDSDAVLEAWYALTLFNTSYPQSEYRDEAEAYSRAIYERMSQEAYEIATFYDFKAKKPKAALFAYESYVQRFPSSKWTPVANERIDELRQRVNDNGDPDESTL